MTCDDLLIMGDGDPGRTRMTSGGQGHVAVVPHDVLLVGATSSSSHLDASYRVRLTLPGNFLGAHGVQLVDLPLFSPEQATRFRSAGAAGKALALVAARRDFRRDLRRLDDRARTIIVQRSVDLLPALGLERAATAGRRVVYDVDDAVWLSGRQTGGHPISGLKGAARKVRWLAERATHVIAGNEFLAEYLSRYADQVSIVPSLVDPAAYGIRRHRSAGVVTLGWIGSPTTAPYLHRLVPVLERFASQSTRAVRLSVVGGTAPRVSRVDVRERRWSPRSERDALAEMDIGLMPLPATSWARGKCAYKALQYMACAIPPIVDDVGMSAAAIGGGGLVARDDRQWLAALHTLAEDADLRAELGTIGRRRIAADYSPQRWIPTLAAILRGG